MTAYRPPQRRTPAWAAAAVAVALVLVAACDNDKDIDPPAELVPLQSKIQVKRLWTAGLEGAEQLRLGLRPASDGERLYAAGHDGELYALNPATGKNIWRTRTRLRLSGGPAVGAGYVVAGSSEGDVVALSAADGKEVWRARVNGEVLAPPAVSASVVVVRTVDGRLRGLNTSDGKELWLNEQAVPRLSLRGTAPPVIVGDTAICGFDNGKVVSVTLSDGVVQWETAIAPSRGRTELERLVDIDSAVHVEGDDVFVAGFQGRAAMLALNSGQIWWAREFSSEAGLAVDEDSIYISLADGVVTALQRRDGAPVWDQPTLARRGLTGPALDGDAVVVADFEGYVHWMSAADGEFLARMKADGTRVSNPPLVMGGRVFVQTDGGRLSAFQRMGAEK